MNNQIIFVGGSKGGVGKSIVTCALIDSLLSENVPLLVVDSDTSNPDVYKSHSKILDCVLIDLDHREGWISLLNKAHASNATVVINSAARNNIGVAAFGTLLMNALAELERELVTFWVINRQRDSLQLLAEYRKTITGTVHVVRNLHAGEATKFELFNESKIKDEIILAGGTVIDFPDLADRVADALTNNRKTISEAAKGLPFGERIELDRWRTETHAALLPSLKQGVCP